MADCSDGFPLSPELGAALAQKASESELRDIAKRELSSRKLRYRLEVGVYSKSDYPPRAIANISGVEFLLPFWPRLALWSWTLDFANNRFLLRSGDRVRYTLTGKEDAA